MFGIVCPKPKLTHDECQKSALESTVTRFFYIFNYSTGAGGVDLNPLTYLPPSSVIVYRYIRAIRLFMAQNFLHLSWDKAETFFALSAGAFCYLPHFLKQLSGFSSVFAVAKQLFVSHGLNGVCCENNKCIRCSQMMCALPKKHHLRFWVHSDSKL